MQRLPPRDCGNIRNKECAEARLPGGRGWAKGARYGRPGEKSHSQLAAV